MSIYSLFEQNPFFILGHRGYSEKYPENTMASFEACAKDKRINGIELDVHLCKSGEVVIAHDGNLKRTAGIDKYIEDMTWDELQNIDVGSFKDKAFANERMPLLRDVFEKFGSRFVYDIELKVETGRKYKKLCNLVWELITSNGLEENVMVSSFNPKALGYFNKVCMMSVPTADIYDDIPSLPGFLRHGWGHHISRSSFSKPGCNLFKGDYKPEKGREMITWTVNSAQEARFLLKIDGIKGFIGNNPVLLADILEEK